MMKVGVITILHVGNYGAELQAYATVRALRKLGIDAEILNYLFYKNPRYRRTRRSAPLYVMSPAKRLKEHLYPILENFRYLRRGTTYRKTLELFDAFHRRHTPSSREYRTIDELYSERFDYDAYVVGSDQVWNPGLYSSLLPYLLDFVPAEKKRISYASSFGVTEVPAELRPVYADAFQKMDAVSVRERQAMTLVGELSGREAQCVLDPTLLLERKDWEQVMSVREVPERYIFVYTISPDESVTRAAEQLGAEYGIPVLRISIGAVAPGKSVKIEDLALVDPGEFLYLISHAELVLTNSFHGTALSIGFGRNFRSFVTPGKKNHSRQHDLLNGLGLEKLLVSQWRSDDSAFDGYDGRSAALRLAEQREKSLSYLCESLLHE